LGRIAWTGVSFPPRPDCSAPRFPASRSVFRGLALLALVDAALLISGYRSAEGGPALPAAAAEPVPQPVGYDPLTAEAIIPVQPTPLDKLRISSQSWRRGGLGSNALVTFTLRNNNDYAVKDVEIDCSFARWDGSHLTDRTRLLPGTIAMRSRKLFARMHVGFVNVNANKANCVVVSAERA
jgi:hypothetical protein